MSYKRNLGQEAIASDRGRKGQLISRDCSRAAEILRTKKNPFLFFHQFASHLSRHLLHGWERISVSLLSSKLSTERDLKDESEFSFKAPEKQTHYILIHMEQLTRLTPTHFLSITMQGSFLFNRFSDGHNFGRFILSSS